jgi:ubiquinone/menaquinone biosynthesis C-methylase UbiE
MLRKLWFNLSYYQKPRWDTGVSPKELMSFISNHSSGQALDLGCGTGTNAITLAKYGWQVTGVDFALKAIQIARKKARQAGVKVTFLVDEVTRLESISNTFDLILDMGCFHNLPPNQQLKYVENINRFLEQNGTFLLYVFYKSIDDVRGPGVTEEDINHLLCKLKLINRQDGMERGIRPSSWFAFQKRE